MKKLVFFAAVAALAAPALAADPATTAGAASAPTTVKAEKPKKERKVCKSFSSSESRLGVMVCKTPTEWAADNGQTRYNVSGRTKGGGTEVQD